MIVQLFPIDETEAIVRAAEKLVQAITFDDVGALGKGGNGGLISRETIRTADELRVLLLRYRRRNI
jgi:hypothetical protein